MIIRGRAVTFNMISEDREDLSVLQRTNICPTNLETPLPAHPQSTEKPLTRDIRMAAGDHNR